MSDPYPKSRQLGRGQRRYRRKVASPKQWAAIRAEKIDGKPCRIHGVQVYMEQAHHLVPRSRGGDDVADNIVPLCLNCHHRVTSNETLALRMLAESVTDAERAYVVGKLGPNGMERLFGAAGGSR
jgi:5-methylcytosine-specific restriction endonuclease McrA